MGRGSTSVKPFLCFRYQKQSFQSIFFNWYLSYEKNTFANNLRVEPTILFMELILFPLKLFSGHCYWQSFIKTGRGPLSIQFGAKSYKYIV